MEGPNPAALRAACALLGWNNARLAMQSGVSQNTVQALLAGKELRGTLRTYRAVTKALTDAGIEFIVDLQVGRIGVSKLISS